MEYGLETKGKVGVLRFDGDLSGDDHAALKHMFVELRRKGQDKVAVDMSQVEFMDSMAIGVFVWGMKNLREVGGDFRLFALTPPVRDLFEITHLDRAFHIVSTEEDAVDSFG